MALPEGYVPVAARIAKFWTQYEGGSITTQVTLTPGTDADGKFILLNTVIATIKNGSGNIMATGHAQGLAGDDKELEKTETSAIGRALVNAGFENMDESLNETAGAEATPGKKLSGGSRLMRKTSVKDTEEAEATKTAAETSEESTEVEVEAEAVAPMTKTPAEQKPSKYDEIMARYRTNKPASNGSATLNGLKR